MLRLRITFGDGAALERAIEDEIARGALFVRVSPPESLAYCDAVRLELASPGGTVDIEGEVMSILGGAGIAVAVPAARLADVRALRDATASGGPGETTHEIVEETPAEDGDEDKTTDAAPAPTSPGAVAKPPTMAARIRLALHGTRDDRAAILRDQDRSLQSFVLKSSKVTLDEVTAWAKNPQMTSEFLKQIGDRRDWLTRSSVAQGLVRNPKTPPELALRALDYVGTEMLRQLAKGGSGVAPHVVAAAKKKNMSR